MGAVLVDSQLTALIQSKAIFSSQSPLEDGQIQPASMDLRLGKVGYRVQAGVLPGQGKKVKDRLDSLLMTEIDMTTPQLMERGAVYVVPLQESLNLPANIQGTVSPKSSTGRLDIFVRLVADGMSTYDTIPAGYQGPLYLEIMPLTFPVKMRAGDKLTQMRLRDGDALCSDEEVVAEHLKSPLSYLPDGEPEEPTHVAEGLWTSVDLRGCPTPDTPDPIVGYKAKHHTQPVDLIGVGQHDWRKYWEPIRQSDCNPLILYPGEFYILVSREKLVVPAHLSAELIAVDTRVGELRVHYAGFFDPGWGCGAGKQGDPAVLEVRAHDVPVVLEHGQRIGRFVYERISQAPQKLYGRDIGSNYVGQKLKLAKQFAM